MESEIREEVFTTEDGLVGVLTRPGTGDLRGRPAVLLLNSGNIHRVGTGRISVILARRLAELGHPVLRFDHSGVGDSPPRRDGLDLEDGRVVEIVDVMAAMEDRLGVDRFVIHGLCTGARDAFYAALTDDRIVGLVQIDGFAYRNFRFYLRKVSRRLGDLPSVVRGVGRRIGILPRPEQSTPADDMWVEEWSEYPPRAEVEEGYSTLTSRGVALYVAFTGSWEEEYNYESQFLDMYPEVDFRDLLTLRYLPDAAHTLLDPKSREKVVGGICEWITDALAPDHRLAS
ncbi:MAG: alpha/beta fold hydrolase [Gemmatimonadota bacterium]|jgi:pimeloyl-ACP methyl ester carboxylesterase